MRRLTLPCALALVMALPAQRARRLPATTPPEVDGEGDDRATNNSDNDLDG